MIEKTFHCVGGDHSIDRMMPQMGYRLVPLREANFVLFSGGQDISPAIYDAKRHPYTNFSPDRDRFELEAFEHCKEDAFKVGICRGGQLLNCLNGGILYQDINNHHTRHEVQYYDENGKVHWHTVNSIHHQMMKPDKSAEVWAVAFESTFRDQEYPLKKSVKYEKDGPDIEVLWYPKSRSLCFQAHPEYDAFATRSLFRICLNRAIHEIDPEGAKNGSVAEAVGSTQLLLPAPEGKPEEKTEGGLSDTDDDAAISCAC